jgi:hypothetical protein
LSKIKLKGKKNRDSYKTKEYIVEIRALKH